MRALCQIDAITPEGSYRGTHCVLKIEKMTRLGLFNIWNTASVTIINFVHALSAHMLGLDACLTAYGSSSLEVKIFSS